MDKAKNNTKPRLSRPEKILLLVGMGLIFIFLLGVTIGLAAMLLLDQTRSGKLVLEIPAELLPTAEYMVTHQPPTPEYLIVDFPRSSEQRTQIDICVLDRYFNDSLHTSRFFVNGSRVPASSIKRSLSSMRTYETYKDRLSDQSAVACIRIPHRIGFYLIEFQRSVLMPDPLYEWAIQIAN